MKVILRNDNKKRGKVLIDTDNLVATAYYNDYLSLDSCEYYIGRVA